MSQRDRVTDTDRQSAFSCA